MFHPRRSLLDLPYSLNPQKDFTADDATPIPFEVSGGKIRPVGGRAKRIFDISMALLALPAVLLLFAIVWAVVRMSSPGPVLFRHERIGFRGVPFQCTKFRTMHVDADAQLARHLSENPAARAEWQRYRKLKKDPRIIPGVGAFLRKTSLDELPQVFDVLRGRMSLVGPRPVTRDEVLLYGTASADYMATRPGITGLWQVSGRNILGFDERVVMDKRYVANWSILGDLSIMLRTVKVLATGHGAC